MTKKQILFLILSFSLVVNIFGQGNVEETKVYLMDKQNQTAKAIPRLLLDAYSRGDIEAYYPLDRQSSVSYAQFLSHFGMVSESYKVVENDFPSWFCNSREVILPSEELIKCMQNNFELAEKPFKNTVTNLQEKKMVYVKLIYSAKCTAAGMEKEGPIFKIRDIKKLKNRRRYKIVNPTNSAVTYTIADYLSLGLVRAERKR